MVQLGVTNAPVGPLKDAEVKKALEEATVIVLPPVMPAVTSVKARPCSVRRGVSVALTCILLALMCIACAYLFRCMIHGYAYTFECGVGYGSRVQFPAHSQIGVNNTLTENIEVDPYKGYERIEVPAQDSCERLTILHDFTVNMTAYRLWRSHMCYITTLDINIVLGPREFIQRAEANPQFLKDYYMTVYESYWAVLPELESLSNGFGYYIPVLCSQVEAYWIEKIPADQLEDFLSSQAEAGEKEDVADDDDDEFALPSRRQRRATEDVTVSKIHAFYGKGFVEVKIYKRASSVIDRSPKKTF